MGLHAEIFFPEKFLEINFSRRSNELAYKYSKRGGHGGKRPGVGRPRKKPEPGPFDEFLKFIDEDNAKMVALLDGVMGDWLGEPEPPPPPMTPAERRAYRKARTAELNNTIRQLRKFGWRVPDDEKDF